MGDHCKTDHGILSPSCNTWKEIKMIFLLYSAIWIKIIAISRNTMICWETGRGPGSRSSSLKHKDLSCCCWFCRCCCYLSRSIEQRLRLRPQAKDFSFFLLRENTNVTLLLWEHTECLSMRRPCVLLFSECTQNVFQYNSYLLLICIFRWAMILTHVNNNCKPSCKM